MASIKGSGLRMGEEGRLLLSEGPIELSASIGRASRHIVGGAADHFGDMVGLDVRVDSHLLELVHVVPLRRALLQHRLVLQGQDLSVVLLLPKDHPLLLDEGPHLLHLELEGLLLRLLLPDRHELLFELLLEDLFPVGGECRLLLDVPVQQLDVVLLLVVHRLLTPQQLLQLHDLPLEGVVREAAHAVLAVLV